MKNILLAVCGLSPQVITETLYALYQNYKEIDAIHIITTRDGKEKIFAQLLSGNEGYYHKFLNDYGIDSSSIDFGPENIHTLKDEHGNELADIITEDDNEKLLKKCLELAFLFTSDPNTSVFFSIAGGRKTMSACLMVAAQMYGRPQDRIYHVLVSPEFESNRDFFFPPKTPKMIKLIDKQGNPFYKSTKYAEVTLVPIPFVSIRKQLSKDYLTQPKDPGTLMLSLIKEKETKLIVNMIDSKIIYKDLETDMMPTRMALYAFFILRKKNCSKDTKHCGICHDCFLDLQGIFNEQETISELYKKISKNYEIRNISDTGILNLDTANFNSYKSRINSDIRRVFGALALKEIGISSIGKRPNTRYGILLDKSKIEIVY